MERSTSIRPGPTFKKPECDIMQCRFLVAIVCLATSRGTLLADSPQGQSPFAKVVLREFDTWDKEHDGRLTFRVVEWWTRNPSLRGEAAAAMTQLHRVLRKEAATAAAHRESNVSDFTRAYFERYNQMSAKERTANYAFDVYFLACKEKLAKESRECFPEGMPKVSAMRQGNIGDCHFLGPLGSMVVKRPGELKEMIRGDQEHGYNVHFPRRQPVAIAPLTDTELGLFSSAGSNGIWLAVLEKACGEVHREAYRMNTLDDADALAAGPEKTRIDVALLTGHHPERLTIPNPAQISENSTRRNGSSARRSCISITANTSVRPPRDPGRIKAPPGMAGGHSYAVLGYNRSNDTVHVWNPWGHEFTPKGREGLNSGYKTVHGAFEMPLRDFAHEFSVVCFETNQPVEHPPR